MFVRNMRAQQPLKMPWILGVRELARARQMVVIQARHPEAQRPRTQQRRPRLAFGGGKRPRRVVAREQCGAARGIKTIVILQTPVVHRDRHVVEQGAGAGK